MSADEADLSSVLRTCAAHGLHRTALEILRGTLRWAGQRRGVRALPTDVMALLLSAENDVRETRRVARALANGGRRIPTGGLRLVC